MGEPTRVQNGRSRRILTSVVFWKFILPVCLVVTTIALGTFGWHGMVIDGTPLGLKEAFFRGVGLPLLESVAGVPAGTDSPLVLDAARVLALTIPPYAFLLVLFLGFRDVVRRMRVFCWRLCPWVKYAVVCGCGWKGFELVKDLRSNGLKVVVIERDPENPFVESCADWGALVLHGDATSLGMLRLAGVRHTRRVYVVCDSDEVNARIVNQLASLVVGNRRATRCYVHLAEQRKRSLLAHSLSSSPLLVNCFNTFETTARSLIARHPLDRPVAGRQPSRVRVVILGATEMGEALLLQALRIGHFRQETDFGITVVDADIAMAKARILGLYPCLAAGGGVGGTGPTAALAAQILPTVTFEPLPTPDSNLLEDCFAVFREATPGTALSVYVCVDDGMDSAALSATMAPKLANVCKKTDCAASLFYYYNFPEDEHKPILEKNVQDDTPGLPLVAFGNFLDECSVAAVEARPLDDLAREIAKFYEIEFGGAGWRDLDRAAQGKHFERLWQESPESHKESNRQAADHIPVKLRSIGAEEVPARSGLPAVEFSPEELLLLAEMEHRRWCAERLLEGWRQFPRTPENEARWRTERKATQAEKRHIDLAPYADLPEGEQDKDFSQIQGIPGFLAAIGKGIKRISEA